MSSAILKREAMKSEGVMEDTLSKEELAAECQARANVYRMLSGAFLEEPAVAYLQSLRSPEAMATLRALGVEFDVDFTATPLEQLQEELAQEYAMLFVVTGGCPAVESLRLYGRFQQQPFFEVREVYQKAGFRVSGGRFVVFDDQLGVELLFVAEMLERAGKALLAGRQLEYEDTVKTIKRFWALHLGKWVRGYSRLLERAALHSFYREMAKLLRGLAEWELSLLGVQVDDVDQGKAEVPLAEIEYEFDPNEPVCTACEHGREQSGEGAAQVIDISRITRHSEGR